MRREKFIPFVLAVVVLLSIFLGTELTASAVGEVTVQVKGVSVEAGQTVTTELIMNGTFAAFQGILIYDTDALTLENIEATSLLSSSLTMFNQDEETSKFLNGSFISASGKNTVADGAVLKFTFIAGSNVSGSYSFSVEQLAVYDEKGVQLTINPEDTIIVPISSNPDPNNLSADPDPNELETSTNTNNPNTSLNPNNQYISPDSNNLVTDINPNNSDVNLNPDSNNPDMANESGNDKSSTSMDEETPVPDTPKGSRLVFLLLIISAAVAIGIVLVVVDAKKNKIKKRCERVLEK